MQARRSPFGRTTDKKKEGGEENRPLQTDSLKFITVTILSA